MGQNFVGLNCRNFGLVWKILSEEKFCPSKILSNISTQKSGKNRTKLSKFRRGIENFFQQIILSQEKFRATKFCPIRYLSAFPFRIHMLGREESSPAGCAVTLIGNRCEVLLMLKVCWTDLGPYLQF